MLPVVVDIAILQQRCANGLLRAALDVQFRRIVGSDDRDDAWHLLSRCKVETGDGAGANRALHQHRMHDVRHCEFRGIARATCHLQPAIDPIDTLSDVCHETLRQAETVCNARCTARRNRTCLKPFCVAGRAP